MRVRVTQNAVSSIERELLAAMEMSQNKTETRQEFLNRLLLESDSLSDEVWGTLSEPAQDWLVSETQVYNAGQGVREFEVTEETVETVEQPVALKITDVRIGDKPYSEFETIEQPVEVKPEPEPEPVVISVALTKEELDAIPTKKKAPVKKTGKKKAPAIKKAPMKKAAAKKVVVKKAPVKTSLSDNPTSAKKGIKYLVRKNLAMDAWELTLYILVQNPDLSFKDFVKKFLKEKRANMTLERSLGYKYKDFQIMKKVMKRMELFETLEERDA